MAEKLSCRDILFYQEGKSTLEMSLEQTELWLEKNGHISFVEIKNSDANTLGSDNWLDLMMNYEIEQNAIHRCRVNYIQSMGGTIDDAGESYLNSLLDKWLFSEYMFFNSENGCEKHLKIQPPYEFLIGKEQEELWVSPADLRRFGDQAKRYVEINERVGMGLYHVYNRLYGHKNSAAVIMSPTEEYQKYNSTYDVINIMQTIDGEGEGVQKAQGMYLVLGRVLSKEKRRFIHNIFSLVSRKNITLEELENNDRQGLINLIPVDRVVICETLAEQATETETLVRYPNIFKEAPKSLLGLAKNINNIFRLRFDEELIADYDIAMYPVINALVSKYMPALHYYLNENPNKREYYRWLRVMVYECQYLWKNQQLDRNNIGVEIRDYYLIDHMRELAEGRLIAGFEIGISGYDYGVFGVNERYDLFNNVQLFTQPWGYELMGSHYCWKHKKNYMESGCRDCRDEQKKDEKKNESID